MGFILGWVLVAALWGNGLIPQANITHFLPASRLILTGIGWCDKIVLGLAAASRDAQRILP
jgi:hypothetical protein